MDSNLEMLVECEHCGHETQLVGTKAAVKYLPEPVHFGSLNRYALQKKYLHFTQMEVTNSG